MYSSEQFASIAALDLTPIKAKLMHKETGEAWSSAYAEKIEHEYRRFLHLVKKFPDEQVAPLFDVDVFWHYHILDTMKYAADCELVFGYFLHHSPYSALESEAAVSMHHSAGARLQQLYEASFGEAMMRDERVEAKSIGARAAAARAAWCAPVTAKTAWCNPATPNTAWCSPATPKTAWCSPATPKTAWCSPAAAQAARANRGTAIAVAPRAAALNDMSYLQPQLAEPA